MRAWIRLLSWLVPGHEREDWREEWLAELHGRRGRMTHAWGALPDAWTLRTGTWTMDGWTRDVRLGVRGLARRPFFTALAGVTLAVGIGANSAIFSVVDAVLLDALPYPESDAIVSMNHTAPGLGVPLVPQSEGSYLHYLDGLRTLESFAVFSDEYVNLVQDGRPRRLDGARISEAFFDVFATEPMLGRTFASGEDRVGAAPVAVVSHALWAETYGGDPELIGRTIDLDGVSRTVVGVMPPGFDFPTSAEVWIPFSIDAASPDPGSFSWLGVGRLAAGATVPGAQDDMQRLLLTYAERYPDEMPPDLLEQAGLQPDVRPLKNLFVQDMAQALWVLLGTVGFVLLIACLNVANLFLVRAEGRQREQAVRTALGASRADMVRLYLSESLSLAVGAGLLGLVLASVGVDALVDLAPVAVPRADEIGIDASVLAFTAVVSLASGVLFGLFPIMGYGRGDLSGTLREGGRSSTPGRPGNRLRSLLVVAQVALALVLLVGSGLMARSFLAIRQVDPGFEAENRLAFRVAVPAAEYPDVATTASFHVALQERMAAIPGVGSAALVSALPLVEAKNASPMEPEDRPYGEATLAPIVERRLVSPGYFGTMGIALDGRELSWDDRADGVRAAVVGRALADLFWPGEDPIGRRVRQQGAENEGWEVVGVAEDVHFESLTTDPAPLLYLPLVVGTRSDVPSPARSVEVVLHVATDPVAFASAAREALLDVDPRIPMVEPRSLERVLRDAMAATSFTVLLLGIAALIALVLGTVGIYGVVSYVVSRRTSEIGVRMALGAPAGRVLGEVLRQGTLLAGVGVAVGLAGAWAVSRVLQSLLYGVAPTDPLTYGGTSVLLVLVAALASWLPARRAARIDPTEALRAE